jgi:AcrR family transcriptional regulator
LKISSALTFRYTWDLVGDPAGEESAMTEEPEQALNRLERRKARTRASLVRAAQGFIAAGRTNVPIQEITQAADVGMGSFYNHFETKEELFDAAVEDALDAFGATLDRLTADIDDPAQVFAQSFRLTGRLHRRRPDLSKVLLHNGLALTGSDKGLAPRARRDIEAAARAGRFTVRDPELALAIVAGAALCLGQLLHDHPERDDAQAADQVTEDLLRMLGVDADEAHDISRRPLPNLDALPQGDTGRVERLSRSTAGGRRSWPPGSIHARSPLRPDSPAQWPRRRQHSDAQLGRQSQVRLQRDGAIAQLVGGGWATRPTPRCAPRLSRRPLPQRGIRRAAGDGRDRIDPVGQYGSAHQNQDPTVATNLPEDSRPVRADFLAGVFHLGRVGGWRE